LTFARGLIENIQNQDGFLQEEIENGKLSLTEAIDKIITAKIADGLGNIISFIETGDTERYFAARNIFSSCQKLLYKAGEWKIWWWVECLKLIIDELFKNSLWQALKSMMDSSINIDVVSRYILANYKSANIYELWRTQTESLDWINDHNRCSFCISVPTSAGKTKAAELAVLRFLLDYSNEPDKKCVYIAPLRKLCQEVEESFSLVLGQGQPNMISSFYGGYEVDAFDKFFFARTRILVVTPEKLDGMLRQYPDLISQIKLIIADEGHLIGEQSHQKYRFLLDRFIHKFRQPSNDAHKPRIILISGVLPNIEDFSDLISDAPKNFVKINWRPVESPEIYKWIWNGEGWQEWVLDENNWRLSTREPIPEKSDDCQDQDLFRKSVVNIAISQSKAFNVLVFSANKTAISNRDFMSLIQCLAKKSPFGQFDTVDSVLKQSNKDISLLLESGISVHHANISLALRREIEQRINNNKIKLLFASPTLAQGVNMPFDMILIYNLQHGHLSPISDAIFWNVVGRVGRPASKLRTNARLEAPKVVFLQNNSRTKKYHDKQNIEIFNQLISRRRTYAVTNSFLDFLIEIRKKTNIPVAQLASQLAEKPSLQDAIGNIALTPWRGVTFERYLIELDNQLYDLLHEVYLDAEITSDWLQQSVKDLVAVFVKASVIKPSDIDYVSEVIQARLRFIAKNVSKERRRQDYMLGLPYEDCQTIKRNVDELLGWYLGSAGLFSNNYEHGLENLVNLMRFTSELTICKKERRRQKEKSQTHKSMQLSFELKADDKSTIAQKESLKSWINGTSNDDLAILFKSFGKYQEIEKTLPWGISAIGRYLSAVAEERKISFPSDLDYLASMVKYGASSKIACHLIRFSIPRKYAVSIAGLYIDKLLQQRNDEPDDIFYYDFYNAINSLRALSDEDIKRIGIDEITKKAIYRIRDRYKDVSPEIEPEFAPIEAFVNG